MANFSICFNNAQVLRQINIGGPWYLWHSLWFSLGFFPSGFRVLLVRQDLQEEAKGQVRPLSVTDPRQSQVLEKAWRAVLGFHVAMFLVGTSCQAPTCEYMV